MTLRLALTALAVVLAALPAQAQLVEENFDYTAASALVGQGGWAQTGTTTTNPITVTSSGLTFAGYPSVTGNAVALVTSGQDVNLSFTQQTSGTVYAAALVNTSAVGSGDYFLHFTQAPITSNIFLGRTFARVSGGEVQFGIGKTSTSSTYATETYPLNTTVLVVLKYEFVTGTTNDIASIYTFGVDDDFSTEPLAPNASNTAGTDATNLGFVNLRQGSTTAGVSPTLTLDGLRVATSWGDLFPAPAPTAFTFVAPTATSSYRAGGSLKPIWTTTPAGGAGDVTVTLRKGGVDVATIYTGPNLEQPDFGAARYTIPLATPAGTDYTVYVELDADPLVNAESDAFEITAPPVAVTAPAGGEVFTVGQTTTVTFVTNGFTGPVRARVYIRRNGLTGSTRLADERDSDGSVDVTLPLDITAADDYFILVRATDGTTSANGKSGVFEIQSPLRAASAPTTSHYVVTAEASTREAYLLVDTDGLAGEIGVFAGDVLVGAARVAGATTEVVVFGADLEDGAPLAVRHFDGVETTLAATAFADGEEIAIAKGAASASALVVAASPNPTTAVATVRVSSPAEVSVYDVLGRRVADLGTVETEARWDASSAAPGVYVVRATGAEGTSTVRVTVSR